MYSRALLVDFVMPLLFVSAGWAIVRWSRERVKTRWTAHSLILRLLLLVVAAEIVENLLLLGALRNYPGRPPLGQLIGVVVGLKLAVFGTSAVALVALAVATLTNTTRPAARRAW